MNKIFSMMLLCVAGLGFAGCAGEEDDLFGQSAVVRLDETKDLYTERMASSEAGWAMEYYPTNGVEGVNSMGYLILVDFNKNGTVTAAMNNAFSGNAYLEDISAWEVIADNGPVLTFNTYNNCIHAFSDPAPNASVGTETGRGAEGDYEFVMVDVPEDAEYVMLKGKKRGTYVRLTRLPEGTDFQEYITDVQAFGNTMFTASAPNMCVITLGDSVMRMADAHTGMPNIYPYDGDAITDESYHPYLLTRHNGKYCFRFRDAMTAPDGSTAQEFVYDEEQDKFIGVENPEFTIDGEDPTTFFVYAMEHNGKTWRLTKSSAMSTEVKAKYEEIITAFSAISNTFNHFVFTYNNGRLACGVNYRNRYNATVTIYYNFSITPVDGGCTLSYDGPANDAAGNVLNTIAPLADMLNLFTSEFAVTATTTKFNLRNITFTAGDGKSFTLTHY